MAVHKLAGRCGVALFEGVNNDFLWHVVAPVSDFQFLNFLITIHMPNLFLSTYSLFLLHSFNLQPDLAQLKLKTG